MENYYIGLANLVFCLILIILFRKSERRQFKGYNKKSLSVWEALQEEPKTINELLKNNADLLAFLGTIKKEEGALERALADLVKDKLEENKKTLLKAEEAVKTIRSYQN